jgi:hypothetical protein
MVSPLYFEKVFMRLTELNSRDIRLPCLKGIAKDFTDIETAKRLLEHENWHIVRNALYLLRFTYNERFVQMVRTVMNHEQKQIRVEASVVLSKYDADDNMPYWQKAVFSPDKEVRVVAVKSVVKIKDTQAKNILDTVLRPQNIAKLAPDEIPLFFEIVVESGRGEFFDLIGVHLFSEERKLRFAAIAAIRTMPPTETIWRLIAKRVASEDFRSLDKEEIDKTLALIREDSVQMIVPALDYVFTLQGGMFDRTKFRPFKEAVFFQVGRLRKAKFVQRWLARAREEGNPETREILEKLGIKS